MIVPITASVSRELFKSVPPELKEGATGSGSRGGRWSAASSSRTRAGASSQPSCSAWGGPSARRSPSRRSSGRVFRIPTSLFQPGDTLASRIAAQYQGAVSNLHVASIIYLALILLVFALLVNFSAQLIVNRFEFKATH